ncbi:alpha/beta hydrolase fold domain-containing protein [Novosphingobium sp. FSY-8]|uniref:Alpha/beta hydrolase fold domain-containing protein n=2 Tax=Novosphingobium ovatum TaxID=1908523 RepID=A0ABW9XBM4_9SPHN|nr:alpha/beta hydrolase fold domain-containing protein [Novosphingobium ovatum]
MAVGLAGVVAPAAHAQGPAPSREALPAPAQPGAIALLPTAPDREVWHLDNGNIAVRNVTRPTLTPFLPVGRGTGAGVIIAPGGGFLGLAIENEGWRIARYFANHGIAAFVLKYRVLPTPPSQAEFADQLSRAVRGEAASFAPPNDTPPEALADGLSALRYVRAHAADYGVDPARIGFMGFSAGGFLTRSVVQNAGADMPAFAAPIYPNMAAMEVPANAPPMFVAIAADDFLLARSGGPMLIDSYRKAGKSIEFHMFSAGDHGFGPGKVGGPTEGWLDLMHRWLRTRGIIKD